MKLSGISLLRQWSTDGRRSGTGLVRQFAVLSLVVIGLITIALCLVISYQFRRDLLEREWGGTADFIRTEAQQVLTAADFADPNRPTAQRHFRDFYDQTVMMPEIVRVKIYDTASRVIWSDEARLIGTTFPDNPQLIEALRGRPTVNLEVSERKRENVFERAEKELVEVYVPIAFAGDPRVVGVVETYKEPAQVFANIRRGQVMVVVTALAGGLLLYGSLFWIVLRAGRRIEAQHGALERQSREVAAASQELRSIQTQLIDAERMAAIGEVVTAVAHGIRNPLANIRASAQVALLDCKDGEEPGLARKSLGNIVTEVDRLEGRVKELLQFVRPADRQSQRLDLNAVLRGALSLVSGRAKEACIAVDEQLAPALPTIVGDPMLLEQVFMNLIGNAIEATPRGGRIRLTTAAEQDPRGELMVAAEVHDTGSGIRPADAAKIFDLFYTTKAQGTGVGLAIARKFTEGHGGRITVRSQPGEGAVFRVTLPAHTEGRPCR
jgi:two-component system, NtrC family, sensor histidine kinase HydH